MAEVTKSEGQECGLLGLMLGKVWGTEGIGCLKIHVAGFPRNPPKRQKERIGRL